MRVALNLFHIGRKSQRLKFAAAEEGRAANTANAWRDFDGDEIEAVMKNKFANFFQLIRKSHLDEPRATTERLRPNATVHNDNSERLVGVVNFESRIFYFFLDRATVIIVGALNNRYTIGNRRLH